MKKIMRILFLVIVICSQFAHTISSYAEELVNNRNRFNIVLVTDASKSMEETDPSGMRYEAIHQFSHLLTEEGNLLGSVVFSTHIDKQSNLALADSIDVKNAVIGDIKSIAPHGFTNIGEGLQTALNMLESQGDKNLPSVIMFLSDGESAMPSDSELKTSLEQKAEAIQTARERKVKIYSIALNANGDAETTEMKQIAQATGGEFKEIQTAQDLQQVFQSFYSLIYGTSTVSLVDSVFPANGRLETDFTVPGLGVEEVNILINGKPSQLELFDPQKNQQSIQPIVSDQVTLLKIKDVQPGNWKLITVGTPGEQVKINMIYNSQLGIEVTTEPSDLLVNPEDPISIHAKLKDGDKVASKKEDYQGYTANTIFFDSYGKELKRSQMTVADEGFTLDEKLPEGIYHYQVLVTGNGLEKYSSKVGPITVSSQALTEKQKNNTVPTPVEKVVKDLVITFPFKGGDYSLDLNTLAKDKEDKVLHYQIISSSFMEDDYTISKDNLLEMKNFSLSKGAFTIQAIDSGGLSTEIEVVVSTFNVGWALLALILAGALFFSISAYLLTMKPFNGTIRVTAYLPNQPAISGNRSDLFRGRAYLGSFINSGELGLPLNKTYFQATGKGYVYFITSQPVWYEGQSTKKVTVKNRAAITIDKEGTKRLEIVYETKTRPSMPFKPGKPKIPKVKPVKRPPIR
ncbi:TPA: VWA domain-containing protein [Streptococcus suis]